MQKSQVLWLVVGLSAVTLLVLGFFFVLRPLARYEARNYWPVNRDSVIPAEKWKRFTSREGGFSIRFPGVPQTTNVVSDGLAGENLSQPFFFVQSDTGTEYAVAYGDFSNGGAEVSPKRIFDICEAEIAKDIGKITEQKDTNFQGNPVREFEFVADGKANFSGKMRMIFANRRLYQVEVIFLAKYPHPVDFNIFLSSFSLLDQPT